MAVDTLDARQLERLLEVGRALVSQRDPEEVLKQALELARELTGARYAALGILDEDKRQLGRFLTVGIDEELRQRIGPLPRGHGILGELIRDPRPLRLARISDHPRSYGFPAEHPAMNTFLGAPVMIRGEVYGNVYLTEKEGGVEFDQNDERLLVVLADWAAVAVDNARAHEISRRRQAELERVMRGLEATASLNREVVGKADLDRVLELVVKRSRALADARCSVVLLAAGNVFRVAQVAGDAIPDLVGTEIPAEGSPALDVLRAGRGQLIRGPAAARFGDHLGLSSAAAVVVPLRSRGVDLGALAVFDRVDPAQSFESDELVTLESFATAAAMAISAAHQQEDERTRLSIASSERERQRWARELHDETLQELGALSVLQESALKVADGDAMRRTLTRANEQVERIIEGLHGLITDLRPAALDQLGTAAAIEALATRMRARSGLAIEVDLDLAYESGREQTRQAPELEATLYRTVQEALTNAAKHAQASRVRVSIDEGPKSVVVVVEDDGRGFDEDAVHDGFGLLGMRERVALGGGQLEITSVPGRGTRVKATLPVSRAGS